jgi:hypothetical protein
MSQTAEVEAEHSSAHIRRRLSVLYFLIMLLSACGPGQGGEPPVGGLSAQDAANPQRLDGDWVLQGYAEALLRSRDPQQAIEAVNPADPILLRISRSDDGEAWLAVLNFHEGVSAILESRDSLVEDGWRRVRFSHPFDWPLLAGDHAVKKDAEGRLTWRIEADSANRDWVLQRADPSIEQWASVVVLGGSYTDGTGRPIDFGEDGLVLWKDSAHSYRVHLDMVGVDCPYLELVSEDEERRRYLFGFRREGQLLLLFDAGSASEPVITCEGTPLLILTSR